MRILAFESFDTGSHRAVREAIAKHSAHEWCWITMPGRAWKWRMRLGALEMLDELERQGLADVSFDAVFATSPLNVAELRGACPQALRTVPFVLYMHENQAAYPPGREPEDLRHRDVHFALTNLVSVRAADLTIWNSRWNWASFVDGIRGILANAPERSTQHLLDASAQREPCVIWPPVSGPPMKIVRRARPGGASRVRVVWPHRWEHDKGPGELLATMRGHASLPIDWAIIGESFREQPEEFDIIKREFGDRLFAYGRVERDRYYEILQQCDWVLSTAQHEFFGIAVVEAMLAGCLPWLPDRLSYPELLPSGASGWSPARPPDDPDAVRSSLAAHLVPARAPEAVARLDQAMESAVTAGAAQS